MDKILDRKEVMSHIEEDIKIDSSRILEQIEQHPFTVHKYIKRLNIRTTQLRDAKTEYESVFAKRYKFYKEKYDPVLSSATEISAYTKGDSEVQDKQKEINMYESDVTFLKDVVDQLKQKYFLMKLQLDYKVYMRGDG